MLTEDFFLYSSASRISLSISGEIFKSSFNLGIKFCTKGTFVFFFFGP